MIGFGFALSFKFASVMFIIVKEKEERCRQHEKISGLKPSVYWIANLMFDLATYLLLAAFIGGISSAARLPDFIGDAAAAAWLALILYGPANLLFTYLLSFLYSNHENAMAMHFFTNFLFAGILPAIIMVLRILDKNCHLFAKNIAWVLRLLPSYCFG